VVGASETSSEGLTRHRVFDVLGVVANLIAIYSLVTTDAKAVVWFSSFGALILSTYIVGRRWLEHRRHVPLLGIGVGLVGAVVATTVLAYDIGESRASSRSNDLEEANADLEHENAELSADLEDAQEQLSEEQDSATTSTSTSETTTTTNPQTDSTTSTAPSETQAYLADLEPVTGVEDYLLESGEWSVEGTVYSNSLGSDIGCASSDYVGSEYNIARAYRQFHAFVGLSDNAGSNEVATFILEVDGTQRLEREVRLGETVEVTENIEGTYRIALYVSTDDCYDNRDAYAVWGDAAVLQ
jgi:hypothetical protein